MTYSEKLQDPRWQKKRLIILERDNWTCQLCYDEKSTLNIHHLEYSISGNPWDAPEDKLITYRRTCHRVVESLNVNESPCIATKMLIDKDLVVLHLAFSLQNSGRYIGIYEHYTKSDILKNIINISENRIKAYVDLFNLSEINAKATTK